MKRKQETTITATYEDRRPNWMIRTSVGLLLIVMALVLGVVTARAQNELPDAMAKGWSGYDQQPLRVNVWHDQDDDEIYSKGESVRIHFEANLDAYAVVYRIDADGEVSILWPRSRFDDGFVFGNHTYHLPVPGAPRVRAASSNGVEYVQALISAYPFDLRNLDIDFHHEREDDARAFYVAGDPFLAMNDINFEVTQLEDPEDFVVSNYTSWYVGRQVDHPRYLCSQCHDSDPHPYRESCTVEIHHDYGWSNDWYVNYGYYPAYHYPVYYYVDPWTMRPWVNYWYRPWYAWPSHSYTWGYNAYAWNYSPYWTGDVWSRYKSGSRHYRPLSKGTRYKTIADGTDYRHPRSLGKTARPSKEMRSAMIGKSPLAKKPGRVTRDNDIRVGSRSNSFKDVTRSKREQQKFTPPSHENRRGGIQVRESRYPSTIGSGTVRGGAGQTQVRPNPQGRPTNRVKNDRRSGSATSPAIRTSPGSTSRDRNLVRPVEPRSKGSRIWNGGRNSGNTTRAVKPNTSAKPRTPTVQPRTTRPKQSTPKVRSRKSGSSQQQVRPKSTNRSSSSKSSGSRSSGSKSGSSSSSSSKSRGGSAKKR